MGEIRESDLANGEDEKQEKEFKHKYDFFNLQVSFANRLSELSSGTENEMSFKDALDNYTGLSTLNNVEKVSEHLNSTNTVGEVAKDLYEKYKLVKVKKGSSSLPELGFYSTVEKNKQGEDVVFFHFRNSFTAPKEESAFSKEQQPTRKREVFNAIKNTLKENPEIKTVVTRSWLCNHKGYREVFPPEWTENMKESITPGAFRRFDVWGQFLSKEGDTKKEKVEDFLEKIKEAKSLEELLRSFPYLPLETSVPVEVFAKSLIYEDLKMEDLKNEIENRKGKFFEEKLENGAIFKYAVLENPDEFLTYLVNNNYVLHGTTKRLEELEPNQANDSSKEFGNENAVYLTSNPIVAKFCALVGGVSIGKRRDSKITLRDKQGVFHYSNPFFEVENPEKIQDKGYIYVFPDSVVDNTEGLEHIAKKKIKPSLVVLMTRDDWDEEKYPINKIE